MDKVERHRQILDEIYDLYKRKNSDYGDSVSKTYEKYGMTSFLIRMEDKLNRLHSITSRGIQDVNDEKIIDTLTDLANYAIIARIEYENEIMKGEGKHVSLYRPKH